MAGGQFGMMFLPRVGQEVIVDFLEGNPDRPIITGRVYNGDCMPPYKLPDYKTRSCIRTSSTPGGYGANEIRFEDKKYYEHLLLYAQRDFHLRSKASCFHSVGGESHQHVYKDCFEKFDQNKSSEICLDLAEKVGGNQSLTVMGQLREAIYGKHSESCSDYSLKAKNGEVVIEAATGITLKVGGNFIKIDAAGVHVMGTLINLNSGGVAGIGYWGPVEKPRKPKAAYGTEYGQDVQYRCTPEKPPESSYLTPPIKPGEPEEPDKPTSWIEIELVDEAGQPWPNEPYEVVCPDGTVVNGTLDANGQAHVAVETDGACDIRFPKLDMAAWERS
jgi:type VI secretion system secreted protein VgrG